MEVKSSWEKDHRVSDFYVAALGLRFYYLKMGLGRVLNNCLRPFGLAINRMQPPKSTHLSLPAVPNLPQLYLEQCRVLSSRGELLKILPQGGITAEIGVADGDYSAEILTNNRPAVLHLIDDWANERYTNGINRVRERFSPEISAGSVVIHQGLSTAVLPTLAHNSFDLVYLDTTHAYSDTVQELRLSLALMKDSGRIAGHDFCTGSPEAGLPYGVVQAVFEFCAEFNWAMEYICLDGNAYFSYCLKRMK